MNPLIYLVIQGHCLSLIDIDSIDCTPNHCNFKLKEN